MRFNSFISLCLLVRMTMAQGTVFDSEPGFIKVLADTTTVPIYVNGSLVGHTPLENPIPVYQGIHHITHHPPSISDPFLQYTKTNGVKQIFVLSGDTVTVILNTHLLANRISQAKKEHYFTNYIGIGVSLLVLWQLWVLAN